MSKISVNDQLRGQAEYIAPLVLRIHLNIEQLGKAVSNFFDGRIPDVNHSYRVLSSEAESVITIDDVMNITQDLLRDLFTMAPSEYFQYLALLDKAVRLLNIVSDYNDALLSIGSLIISGEASYQELFDLLNLVGEIDEAVYPDIEDKMFQILDDYLLKLPFHVAGIRMTWEKYLQSYVELNLHRIVQVNKVELEEIEYLKNQIIHLSFLCANEDVIRILKLLRRVIRIRINALITQIEKMDADSVSDSSETLINLVGEKLYLDEESKSTSQDIDKFRERYVVDDLKTEIVSKLDLISDDKFSENSYKLISKLISLIKILLNYHGEENWLGIYTVQIISLLNEFKSFYNREVAKLETYSGLSLKYLKRIKTIDKHLTFISKHDGREQ